MEELLAALEDRGNEVEDLEARLATQRLATQRLAAQRTEADRLLRRQSSELQALVCSLPVHDSAVLPLCAYPAISHRHR